MRSNGTEKKGWVFLFLGVIPATLLLVLFLFTFFATDEENVKEYEQLFHEQYGIYALELPDSLNFAKERVPMEQFDVRESLDRELLINTYWQSQTLLFLKRANRYFPIIETILKEEGVPEDFKYLAVAESGLAQVVSPSNAVGFWQFLEGTAKDYGLEVNGEVDERYHIEKSTRAACKYFKEAYTMYGNWTLVAASYNMGKEGINKQIERQKETYYYDLLLGEETGRYLYRILALKTIMNNPSKYGFYFRKKDLYPEISFFTVTVNGAIESWADFAKRYGINYKILKIFNPWLREAFLTNKEVKTYEIKIPKQRSRTLLHTFKESNDHEVTGP